MTPRGNRVRPDKDRADDNFRVVRNNVMRAVDGHFPRSPIAPIVRRVERYVHTDRYYPNAIVIVFPFSTISPKATETKSGDGDEKKISEKSAANSSPAPTFGKSILEYYSSKHTGTLDCEKFFENFKMTIASV